MSKRIFLTNRVQKQVQRFGSGGLFKALTDPAASAFNTIPLFTAGEYQPMQAPQLPPFPQMGGGMGRGAAPAKASTPEALKLEKMHANAASVFQQRYDQKMGELNAGVKKYGADFLLTPQAQQLTAEASKVDQADILRAQNAFAYDEEIYKTAKDSMNDVFLDDRGFITMLDKDGNVQRIDHRQADQKVAKEGWGYLTGQQQWDLRESGKDVNLAFDKMDDFRSLRTWKDASANIAETLKHTNLGDTARGRAIGASMQQVGNILGISEGKTMDEANTNQLRAAYENLVENGGLDQRDYMAYVRNFISKNKGTVDKATGRNVYQSFGEYLKNAANSQSVTKHDENLNFTGSESATTTHNAPQGPTTQAHDAIVAGQKGDFSLLRWDDTKVGSTNLVMPTAPIPLPQSLRNFKDGVYENTLTQDSYLNKIANMTQAQLPDGTPFDGELRNKSYWDGQKDLRVTMMPTKNGKISTLSIPEQNKLKELHQQYGNTPAYTQAVSAYMQEHKYEMKPFVAISVTGGVYKANIGEKGKYLNQKKNLNILEGNEPNRLRAEDSFIKDTVFGSVITDPKTKIKSWFGSPNYNVYTTEVYAPFNDNNRDVYGADQMIGLGATIKGPQPTMTNTAGVHEEGGTIELKPRIREKPAFTFKPITLRDLR